MVYRAHMVGIIVSQRTAHLHNLGSGPEPANNLAINRG